MLYVGLFIVAIGSGLFLYDYTLSLRRKAFEYREILSFLVYARAEIEGSGKAIPKIVLEFLEKRGRGGESVARALSSEAFRKADLSSLIIEKEDKERLASWLRELGFAQSRGEELGRLGALISVFEKKSEAVCDRTDKRIKSVALIYAASLLSAILLVI